MGSGIAGDGVASFDILNMAEWSEESFSIAMGSSTAITLILCGLMLEYFFSQIVLSALTISDLTRLQHYWMLAQACFPLLVTTGAFGGIPCYPLLVLGLWKFGFPETLYTLSIALGKSKSASGLERVIAGCNGLGFALHHSSACFWVTGFVNVEAPTRATTLVVVPLIMQHWLALLRYNYQVPYVVLNVLVEAWWEYNVMCSWPELSGYWILPGYCMLIAHWLYFLAGFLCMFKKPKSVTTDDDTSTVDPDEEETPKPTELEKSRARRPRRKSVAHDEVSDMWHVTKPDTSPSVTPKLTGRPATSASFQLDPSVQQLSASSRDGATTSPDECMTPRTTRRVYLFEALSARDPPEMDL